MLTASQSQFRDRAIALARQIAPEYNLDWRLMAATAILESGWGESALARKAHNYFGIKATRRTPAEAVYLLKRADGASEPFRRYADDTESFHAYGRLVGQARLYERPRQAACDAAFQTLVQALAPLYCPGDPQYPTKIFQIAELLDSNEIGNRS
ncbi:MAG TPA: glucosaminidase domain-containing protein [Candidatus Sumerlaeota bacterium]|nr:glucosaminidase domain-containing protein [Candidatus Sumerlaeota bacterium]HPS02198.1 glucosaminidase domain-containing protein [Candidatus Sumerlaeota bacterium]